MVLNKQSMLIFSAYFSFGYILTYSMLLRENIRQGDLNISASAVPNNKDTFKTKRNGKLQHIKVFEQ